MRVFLLAAALLLAITLSGCGNDTAGPEAAEQTLRAEIMDVRARDLQRIESLTVRDANGQTWVFESRGPLEFTPSHVREHMVLGEPIEVTFHEDGDILVVDGLAD
jgi:predicted small lipoprotein YifL